MAQKSSPHRMAIVVSAFVAIALCSVSCSREKSRKIAVVKFATHPALNELETNFIETLRHELPDVEIEALNAHGSFATANQLAQTVSRPGIDLIVSLATPATQAVAKVPSTTPILYAAVADPEGAGIVSPRTTGIQNASKSIVKKALETAMFLDPTFKRVGTLYNPSEQNSVYVQKFVKEVCSDLALTLEQRTISNPDQIDPLVRQLKPQVDVLYSANDNTLNKGAQSAGLVCQILKMPFIIGELSAVDEGALAGVGVDYESMGKDLAALAKSILIAPPGTPLPPRRPPPPALFWLNLKVANKIGFKIPQAALERADKVIK